MRSKTLDNFRNASRAGQVRLQPRKTQTHHMPVRIDQARQQSFAANVDGVQVGMRGFQALGIAQKDDPPRLVPGQRLDERRVRALTNAPDGPAVPGRESSKSETSTMARDMAESIRAVGKSPVSLHRRHGFVKHLSPRCHAPILACSQFPAEVAI